ncbi:hypothetical protein [Komagataeibacter saccharivorans]|uniref:hypothetical protein n=1 Tax=Komagataeibacter saccharivorans TaxID=265959 RepID=UPI0015E10E69|nr:hypothetical protein [Komagataeibacter saccharivorans]
MTQAGSIGGQTGYSFLFSMNNPSENRNVDTLHPGIGPAALTTAQPALSVGISARYSE